MSGWRNFGIELTGDAQRSLVPVRLAGKSRMRTEGIDGYFVAYLSGYGNPGNPDPRLLKILRKTSVAGYYVLADNTTDTASGFIRFREESPLVEVTDLVDPEINSEDLKEERAKTVFDGESSRLPEFRMGAPVEG